MKIWEILFVNKWLIFRMEKEKPRKLIDLPHLSIVGGNRGIELSDSQCDGMWHLAEDKESIKVQTEGEQKRRMVKII